MNWVMSFVHNITSVASADPRRHGAVIHSVTTTREHRVFYGVQSATFTRTVFPGQSSGSYQLNSKIPTWRGTQVTADFRPSGSSQTGSNWTGSNRTGTSRTAGSPPIPYPPRNASAFYSPPQTRIIPNSSFRANG